MLFWFFDFLCLFYLTMIVLISSSLTIFVEMSLNCLDLENKGRFTMPFLTIPYRKVHSQMCYSCHLFPESLKVELFIWSGTHRCRGARGKSL